MESDYISLLLSELLNIENSSDFIEFLKTKFESKNKDVETISNLSYFWKR